MTNLHKLIYGSLILSLTACNNHGANTEPTTVINDSTTTKTTVTQARDISDADNADLKLVAKALSAKGDALQQAIDSIQNRELKYLAIASTIQTPAGETEALSKITNSDVKNLAIAFSTKVDADRKKAIDDIKNEDLKNVAIVKTSKGKDLTEAIANIKSSVLRDFAMAIATVNS